METFEISLSIESKSKTFNPQGKSLIPSMLPGLPSSHFYSLNVMPVVETEEIPDMLDKIWKPYGPNVNQFDRQYCKCSWNSPVFNFANQ